MRKTPIIGIMTAVLLLLLFFSGCSSGNTGGATDTTTEKADNVTADSPLDSAIQSNTDSTVPADPDAAVVCTYRDGTYTGNGSGRSPGIVVEVTIMGGAICDISVVSYNDTYVYFDDAADVLIPDIIAAQSTQVDTFSGATLSSNGILQAVNDALSQAVMQ